MNGRTKEILKFAITGGVCFLIELAALVALRDGAGLDTLIATPIAFLISVVFNYLFIYLLELGVMGAALGTGVAMLITAGLMLYFLLWRSDMLGIFKKQREQRESLPSFRPTPLGTIAIAAHSLAITVESLCYMPGFGISEAATTLVGQGIGAGQKQLTHSFANMSVSLGIGVMTLMGVLMFIFAHELMSVMSPVAAIQALGAYCLRIEAFAEPMFAAAIVCNGVFIGAGDTLKPAIMSLCSMWGVRLTLAALLAREYGLKGVWTAMAIELTFRGVIFLCRLFYGHWDEKTVNIKH